MNGQGHNSAEDTRTCFEILRDTAGEAWSEPVYSGYELTDAPFGNGEIDDSSENAEYYLEVMCHWDEDVGCEPEPLPSSDSHADAVVYVDTPSPSPIEQPSQKAPVRLRPYIKKPIPAELRWAVFRRDGYRCVHCGYDADLTADHIEPEVKGGRLGIDNLQTLCRPCNSKKGAK